MTTIYHNPRCSKSRQALQLLQEANEDIEVILYLEDRPSIEKISEILQLLNMDAGNLIRKSEATWKEHYKGKKLSESDLIQAMHEHPKLIERPIVIKGNNAALGRPPENVLKIL